MRRLLITGVAQRLGSALALRLEEHPDVDAIYGIDLHEPAVALGRTDFVRADTRHAVIAKLIRELEVDTVVHCAVVTHWPGSSRSLHETNVIGTMNVLAACAGEGSPVRNVIVKSGTAVYGISTSAPSFLSEDLANGRRSGPALTSDLNEMESLVQDFAIRNPAVSVTVLRLADILDGAGSTPLGRYFSLPLIPTVAGFDPRLQLLHVDDAVEALYRSVLAQHRGVYNVAGAGIILLSQAVALTGRRTAPVLAPFMDPANRLILRLLGGFDLPDRILELVTQGQVVDTARLQDEFGWSPDHSTRSVMHDFVNSRAAVEPPEFTASAPQERELDLYIKRRRRTHLRVAR